MRRPFRDSQRKLTPDDLLRCRLPSEFWQTAIDKIPDTAEHKAPIKKFLTMLPEALRERWVLVLLGPFDAGKTALASIVQKHAIAWGASTLFVTAQEAIGFALDSSKRFDDSMSLYDRMITVDNLTIDELGMEHNTDNVNVILEKIIRARLADNLSLNITSNLDKKMFAERYPGIYSAIQSKALFINVLNISWRSKEQSKFIKEFKEM